MLTRDTKTTSAEAPLPALCVYVCVSKKYNTHSQIEHIGPLSHCWQTHNMSHTVHTHTHTDKHTHTHIWQGLAATKCFNTDKHTHTGLHIAQTNIEYWLISRHQQTHTHRHTPLPGLDRVSLSVYICKLHVVTQGWLQKSHTHTDTHTHTRTHTHTDTQQSS